MFQIAGLLHPANHILKSRIFTAQESRVIAQHIIFISLPCITMFIYCRVREQRISILDIPQTLKRD
jgi:hypothetical protein